MTRRWRRTLWLAALALPLSLLWLLPLSAQQSAEKADSAAAAPVPEPEAAGESTPADERVSADNNLTFPVDI